MTNAEYFLKDGTKEEFERKLAEFMVKKYDIEYNKDNIFIEFLNAEVQPTLTENKTETIYEQLKQYIDDASKFFVEVLGFDKKTVAKAKEDFLKSYSKPTLTEDERVILMNIDKEYSYIYRNKAGNIELHKGSRLIGTTHIYHSLEPFKHLFQFIKERRRISY